MSSQRSVATSVASEWNALVDKSGRILTAKYLEKATSKKDIAKRLRIILRCLRDDENVEPDSEDYPGLAALCHSLTKLVNHRDKEIRLYTVASCMELFTIYAPEAPWGELETLDIFKQTIRQLANLGHTLRPGAGGAGNNHPSTVHFYQYYRILELLAEVKIAVLLVDLSKKNDDDHDDQGRDEKGRHNETSSSDDSSLSSDGDGDGVHRRRSPRRRSQRTSTSTNGNGNGTASKSKPKTKNNVNREALQVLSELFRTLLQSVRNEHPTEIFDFCQRTLTSCVEEFFESTILPIPILDELLLCIGQGPRVLVLQQAPRRAEEASDARSKPGRKRSKANGPPAVVTVQQNNPSYVVASAVVRASVDRLSTPIASLLNGLVNSDPRSIGQSTISNHVCERSDEGDGVGDKAGRGDRGIPEEVRDMVHNLGKAQRQQQDVHRTSNVYSVIVEMHRVAPAILTTVFGNLASQTETLDVAQRILVLHTLGKLFAGNPIGAKPGGRDASGSGNFDAAYLYNPCFRNWLQRSGDRCLEIRRVMVPHLLALLRAGSRFLNGTASPVEASSPHAELARDVQEALIQRVTQEPSAKFRTEVIQELCTLSYQHRKVLSRRVMDKIGQSVMSRDKSERKDALTGLVQLHFRHYTRHHLATVLEGGDDCPIESVLQVLAECCPPPSRAATAAGAGASSSLIAARSKASSLSSLGTASSPRKAPKGKRGRKGTRRSTRRRRDDDDDSEEDESDRDETHGGHELSHRDQGTDDFSYYQWIPCVLFESVSYTDAIDSDMHSRVVQLVDELLLGCSSPHPENRRKLTSTGRATGLAVVVDAVRNQSPMAWHGMAQLLSVRSKLQKSLKLYLDSRACIRNFQTGSEDHFAADAKAKDLLEKVASMIPPPSGPSPAPGERHAILEKFHSMKDKHVFRILGTIANPSHSAKARARALDDLPKRVKAAAGDAVSAWVKSLVKRCAMGDFVNHDVIHHCVLLAQECFHEEQFEATQKFLVCIQLAVESFPSLCASDEVFENLSELFRDCNSTTTIDEPGIVTALSAILASVSPYRVYGTDATELKNDLHEKLVSLCRKGTPEQTRHAVATIASHLKPKNNEDLSQEQAERFLPLLQTLATPSRLAISSTGSSKRIICLLTALAELAEHAPRVFEVSSRGTKALKFALEKVLMGRAHINSSEDDEGINDSDSNSGIESDDEIDTKTPKKGRTGRKSHGPSSHLSPSASAKSQVEDENLSVSCRTLCAAIEFLTTFIRSTIFRAKKTRSILPQTTLDLISDVFHNLSQILRYQGLPPSSRDRKLCSLRQDRAALRQCAAIQLFRLCDTRLALDQKHLTTERWHYLAACLLDDERIVRKAVMEELGLMITAHGKFAATHGLSAMAPRLRFVAMSVFCIDGSQGVQSRANGNAANIGKAINSQKGNISGCIAFLRKVHESTAAQRRAQGPEAEKQFESVTKLTVMPEYAVPYAFHLLTYRYETPSSTQSHRGNGGKIVKDKDEIDENAQKVLKKRLKALFDPLVLQLGASADNISFLLRMAEILAQSFQPIRYKSASFENEDGRNDEDKLIHVCETARQVLLTYIKTDANLDSYPGEIRMPGNLFRGKENRKIASKLLRPTRKRSLTQVENVNIVNQNRGVKRNAKELKKPTKPRSKTVKGIGSKQTDENRGYKRVTRRSLRSNANLDDNDSKLTDDADVTLQNKDLSVELTEDHSNQRKKLRRSTRSTRSTAFGDLNNSDVSSRGGTSESKFTEKESLIFVSSQTSSNLDGMHSLDGKERPSYSGRSKGSNKKRSSEVSEGSFEVSRVHFSPEVGFGGLSPINRRSSRDSRNDQVLLSSSETKTRGTTPPSSFRGTKLSDTPTLSIGSTHSSNTGHPGSPRIVTKAISNRSTGANSPQARGRPKPLGDRKTKGNKSLPRRAPSKLATADKENANARVARKRKETPKQITVVRSKPSPVVKVSKATSNPRRSTTSRTRRSKKSKPLDEFDFGS